MSELRLSDVIVIVTGVGCRKAERIFHGGRTCELIQINGVSHKINIGTAVAKLLAETGASVCMVSRDKQTLSHIKRYISEATHCDPANISYYNIDLLDERSVENFVSSLSTHRPIWLVHSVGLGAQAYDINGDNPYLPFTKIPVDLVAKEFEVPVRSLLLLVKSLEPRICLQAETRIVVVTSMSGVRPYMYGYSHNSAKAGVHYAVRSLSLEFSCRYKSVYVTEVLPGIVDTGLYDSDEVIRSVQEIGETFGFFAEKRYTAENFPLAPPSSVAEAIALALQSDAHILSIDMVAHGQFTNIGG